ncbi:hypothetical protein TNCT_733421 [Trichonephila clavata]|uniref:Mos1 transposase HTH domain-containing protein n=1 Tax=Trichonephila clavata TaxID=2740835 RepID=A0A8X6G2D7_TRICU|nr:hypothetical protein TNCT_733421 [Trichonephila clavata]
MLSNRRNSRDFRILFLYKWKSDHIAAEATRNRNTAFEASSVNECTNRWWYIKFEFSDASLTKEYRVRLKTVLDIEILRVIVEQIPNNTVRDYAEELGIILTTNSRKKND